MSAYPENTPTVQSLRTAGYKVRVIHYRKPTKNSPPAPIREIREDWGDLTRVESKGGRTEVSIRTPEGNEYEGIAECSLKDSFFRKQGLYIAVSRALAKIPKYEE